MKYIAKISAIYECFLTVLSLNLQYIIIGNIKKKIFNKNKVTSNNMYDTIFPPIKKNIRIFYHNIVI